MTATALGRSKFGPTGYDLELMLRALLLGQFHNFSDPKLEQSFKFRLDFAWFTAIDVFGCLPDKTSQSWGADGSNSRLHELAEGSKSDNSYPSKTKGYHLKTRFNTK